MSQHDSLSLDGTILDDRGSIQIAGENWIVGTMTGLKKNGKRGVCLRSKQGCGGIVAVSSHLRKGTSMYRETVIHETLHAALPKATEEQVAEAARAVTKALKLMEVKE